MLMKKITNIELESLTAQAQNSGRLRKNYNYHKELSDTLQRMLNAMEPFTYVQPHKHENPDKREAFVILTGRIVAIQFDMYGNIEDYIVLDRELGNYGAEFEEGVYHMLISLKKGSVVYEVKDGPYIPIQDKDFAQWAPKEGEPGCEEYIHELLKKMNLTNP